MPMPGGGVRPHPASPDHLSVCDQCGGKNLKGVAAPSYNNGKYSVYVPPDLRGAFEAALGDSDLLNFGRVLALMVAREDQLRHRLDTGESGRIWKALQQEWAGLAKLLQEPKPDGAQVRDRITAIGVLMNRGSADAQVWDDLFELWEQMRRTAETEMKRREKGRQLVPIEDVMWHVRATLLAFKEGVESYPGLDPATRMGLLQAVGQVYSQRYGTRSAKLLGEENGHDDGS
jgi:hypothetical protein